MGNIRCTRNDIKRIVESVVKQVIKDEKRLNENQANYKKQVYDIIVNKGKYHKNIDAVVLSYVDFGRNIYVELGEQMFSLIAIALFLEGSEIRCQFINKDGRKITKIFDTLPLDAQSDIAEALGRKVY
jgi:hypothetical protein